MGLFDIFKRKKKVVVPIDYDTRLFQTTLNLFSDFGDNINASDVVKICIDRIATHSAKLKPRYVKTQDDKTVLEKKGNLAYLLKFQPNPMMTPYDFIYRVVTLLYLNNNAFIYPVYDPLTYDLLEFWPIKPNSVEALKDESGELYLRFYFTDKKAFTLLGFCKKHTQKKWLILEAKASHLIVKLSVYVIETLQIRTINQLPFLILPRSKNSSRSV